LLPVIQIKLVITIIIIVDLFITILYPGFKNNKIDGEKVF
jgi:hypothetical protein